MRSLFRTRPRRPSFVVLATTASLLTVAMLPTAASAHGDEGEMELTRFEQVGPDRVEVEVGIVYANDGHLAEDAAVSAALTLDDGTTVGPVELTRQGEGTSLYGATVDLPAAGTWSVSVTSTDPDAGVDGTLVVDEPPATTETSTTTEAPTTTAATEDTSVVSPPTDDLAAAVEDDTGNFVLVILITLVVVALVGGGVWWSRRDRPDDSTPPADDH